MNAPGHPPRRPGGPAEDDLLARVQRLVRSESGIVLDAGKGSLVRARLARRVAATGQASMEAYLDLIEGPRGREELAHLVSAMTTNVTGFFREAHHFQHLAATLIPRWRASPRQRRLWSAGCASGPEAYSIAMTLCDAGLTRGAARILATDIDRAVLRAVHAGRYTAREVAALAPVRRARHFRREGEAYLATDALRELVTVRALNLAAASWPPIGLFDAIFCRNVAIYFDAETQARLWRRLIAHLAPGGCLFIGHSERLPEAMTGRLVSCRGRTIYELRADADRCGAP